MDPVLSLLPPTHIVQIWIQFSPFYPLQIIITLYKYLSSSLPFTPFTNNYPVPLHTHCTNMDPVLPLLPPTHIVQIFIQFSPFYPYTHCTNMDPVLSLLPPTHIVQIWIQFSPFYPLHPLYKYGSSSLPFTPYTHCTNIYPVLSLLPLHTLYK